MKLRIPKHEVDSEAVYVWTDEAAKQFDWDRIKREESELKAAHTKDGKLDKKAFDEAVAETPMAAYVSGESRYAIGLVEEYVSETAARFYIQKLSRVQYGRVAAMLQNNFIGAMALACQMGLVKAEDNGGVYDDLTAEQLNEIGQAEAEAATIPLDTSIGIAVFNLTKPITASEKKPSASSPG